jgi:hypothetical protein
MPYASVRERAAQYSGMQHAGEADSEREIVEVFGPAARLVESIYA